MKSYLFLFTFFLFLSCGNDDENNTTIVSDTVDTTGNDTSSNDTSTDNTSNDTATGSNVSSTAFDPATNTVTINKLTTSVDTDGNEVHVYEDIVVEVFDIPESDYKFYTTDAGYTFLVMLDESGEIIYDSEGQSSVISHNAIPKRIAFSGTTNDENFEVEVYYSNAADPNGLDGPTEMYEYVFKNLPENKTLVGFSNAQYEGKFQPSIDINWIAYGETLRQWSVVPYDAFIFEKMIPFEYRGMQWEYEENLYESTDEVIDIVKENYDQSVLDMSQAKVSTIDNLQKISIFNGARDYWCGAMANCEGEAGFIQIFYKNPDVYTFTHEIGHTWSLKESSPVDWDEWEALRATYYVSDYGRDTNVSEYFADAFFAYFSSESHDYDAVLPDAVRAKLDSYFK
ncbi:MAG: hypothetical protein ACON47_10250 [Flavobacteriaceae bacterium]